jgi:hypothetical protein
MKASLSHYHWVHLILGQDCDSDVVVALHAQQLLMSKLTVFNIKLAPARTETEAEPTSPLFRNSITRLISQTLQPGQRDIGKGVSSFMVFWPQRQIMDLVQPHPSCGCARELASLRAQPCTHASPLPPARKRIYRPCIVLFLPFSRHLQQ